MPKNRYIKYHFYIQKRQISKKQTNNAKVFHFYYNKIAFFFVPLQPETVKVDSDSINIGLKQKRKVKGYL